MSSESIPSGIRDRALDDDTLRARLAKTWATPRGLWGALTAVDHKSIARRYLVTAFIFLALGGILAVLMRLQLSRPESRVLGPVLYNQVITMHGSNKKI